MFSYIHQKLAGNYCSLVLLLFDIEFSYFQFIYHRQIWISCYGLAWPNEEIEEFHLVIYVRKCVTESNPVLLTKLVKLLEDDKVENWVELIRQTKEVEVRFLADKPEPNHNVNDDINDEPESFAQPGASVVIQRDGVGVTELNPSQTAKALGDYISSRGALTAICHKSSENQHTNSFALTCFHVGYNGENDLERPGLQTIEHFRHRWEIFQGEARNPCPQQKETNYHYQPQNENRHSHDVGTSCLGKYVYGLFDKDKDLLLIHIGEDVKFKCAIEKYSGEWGMTWYRKKLRKKGKKRRKNQAKQDEVVKIGPQGIRHGKISSNLHPVENDHLFEGFYVVCPTDPFRSFLEDGDSGSLVCIVNDGKYTPVAYGVCETDLGNGNLGSLCLDLEEGVEKLKSEGLSLCFGEKCTR